MGTLHYWRAVIGRASGEAWAFSQRPPWLVRIVSYGIAVLMLKGLVLVSNPGLTPDQVGDELRWAAALAGAAIVLYVPLFLWRTARVPALIAEEEAADRKQTENELRAEVARLTKEELTAAQRQAIATQIGLSYLAAGELLAKDITNDDEFAQWSSDADDWLNAIAPLIQRISPLDILRLKAVTTTQMNWTGRYNDEHNARLNALNGRRQIVGEIMERYR